VKQVDELVSSRAGTRFNVGPLLSGAEELPPPTGELTLEEATDRALRKNLSLVAAAENLTIAHGQLMQAGLIQNPTLGQTSATLWPLQPAAGAISFDVLISQTINSIITQPARVSVAKVQETQANIDLATQAFTLTQQVDSKYQEMIHLRRALALAQRITDLYARAVRAAEARSRVGIIPTPELNRARLSFEDSRRQVQHLTTQYARAAQEMNWLMGYSSPPQWRLPSAAVEELGPELMLPEPEDLGSLALKYRLDLLRAKLDRHVASHNLELAKLGLIPQTTLGFDYARDSSRNTFIGPQFQFTLPIFDPGVVALQVAQAQVRKADKTYAALEGQVRQDVRTALANWRIADDDISFYRQRLIPQQEQNVSLMETSFRLGNDDLDTLLNVYQNYVQQLQSYEDAVQAYHDAGVALQQAVGLAWTRILIEAHVPAATQPATTQATTLPAMTFPATLPATTEPMP
jgi:outer membrane protein TolC